MDFEDRRKEERPPSGEAPFYLDEVFFSRTDGRGVIQAGNYVFRRVANYDWSEMLGAPHKMIRHPDMPKGVFYLFWDTIKKGSTIGAYVKNKAKDGLQYWVYAVVVPCAGGYLSARIKPTSEILEKIEKLYAEQLVLEKKEGMSPADSADWLVERIKGMGFPDYQRFESFALSEELIARDKGLKQPPDEAILRFRKMLEAAEQLNVETEKLISEFEMTEIIPHNMRVIASRLEPNGGPISTLSTNYGGMSREMSSWFETHVVGEESNFSTIEGTVSQSMFLECMSRILNECSRQLDFERRKLGDVDLEEERGYLNGLVAEYSAKSESGQNQLAEETYRILDACKKMNRHILGLSTTRVMCKIEGARLTEGRESLTDIIGELNGFQQRIREDLSRIENLSSTIRTLLA
ncbi:PAS domain-containing protein [Pseudoruegeria sp. HB172150]|uniref:PAS domain-containing protein n=1 Tax=Pseudoruegeria sp. HB172150 TaxID=2721164 RepID=UPI001556EFEB|nr:PAS domain-containing protein [Pseudoruegeria sp. HB172150]